MWNFSGLNGEMRENCAKEFNSFARHFSTLVHDSKTQKQFETKTLGLTKLLVENVAKETLHPNSTRDFLNHLLISAIKLSHIHFY